MKCYICENTDFTTIKQGVRTNPNLPVYQCKSCKLVFLPITKPISFYEEDGLHTDDIVCDTMELWDVQRRFDDLSLLLQNKRVLDFGCGNGAFLRKLNREGVTTNLAAVEPNKLYKSILKAQFDFYNTVQEIPDNSCDYITLFHVLEHIPDPQRLLNMLSWKLKTGGGLVIEVPNVEDILASYWKVPEYLDFIYVPWHIFYFSRRSLLDLLALTCYKVEYIKYLQRYPLSNHLYWLKERRPGGHIESSQFNCEDLDKCYKMVLTKLGKTDTIITLLRK